MKIIRIHSSIRGIFVISLLGLFLGCISESSVTISFEVFVGGEPLEFGKNYRSPNGDGTYVINDFKLYVSNIKLISRNGTDGNFVEGDSYHLLKFQDLNQCSFTLQNVPTGKYQKIQISIGVDEEGNFSKGYSGDLDPTNQMAWNWTQGYKFLLFEGLYTPESIDQQIPLVYHVGFSENKKDLEFEIDSYSEVQFTIEIDELFNNPQLIDFHTYPRILFNRTHSSVLSQNYANSFIQVR
jgi:hypothetical protein